MRFWMREVVGWVLVLLGLYFFFLAYSLLVKPGEHAIIEAGEVSVMGFVIFRGGIHLLKVAVAARVCMQAVDEISGDRPVTVPRPARPQQRTLPAVGRRL
jgi:hypothetical protein